MWYNSDNISTHSFYQPYYDLNSSGMRPGRGGARGVGLVCLDFGQGSGMIKQNYEWIFVGGIKSLVVDVRAYVIHMYLLCCI